MRKWSRALLPAMFGMLAAVVVQAADYRTQYAEQWPLTLSSAQSGAYRVVLEPAIYRRAVCRDLGDLQVFNAAGQRCHRHCWRRTSRWHSRRCSVSCRGSRCHRWPKHSATICSC
jgi:hypothetical protein